MWYKCWCCGGLDDHSIQRVQSFTAYYRWEPQSRLYSCHALIKEVQLWGASQFLRVNESQTRPRLLFCVFTILRHHLVYVHSSLKYNTIYVQPNALSWLAKWSFPKSACANVTVGAEIMRLSRQLDVVSSAKYSRTAQVVGLQKWSGTYLPSIYLQPST